jgi:hypothetical protein
MISGQMPDVVGYVDMQFDLDVVGIQKKELSVGGGDDGLVVWQSL